jgi:hypothetical protein
MIYFDSRREMFISNPQEKPCWSDDQQGLFFFRLHFRPSSLAGLTFDGGCGNNDIIS